MYGTKLPDIDNIYAKPISNITFNYDKRDI